MLPNFRWVLILGALLALAGSACAAEAPAQPAENATPNTEPFVPPRVVEPGDAISVHYVGTLDDGELFDSSRERGEVLSFTVAADQMIPGFDAAVRGMALGDLKNVRIEPADAYGARDDSLVIAVALNRLPDGVAAGDNLESASGQRVTVVEVGETEARIDTNHPLAGEALNFEIELVSFDDP